MTISTQSDTKSTIEPPHTSQEPIIHPTDDVLNEPVNRNLGRTVLSILTLSLELILALVHLAIHAGLFAVTAAHNAIPHRRQLEPVSIIIQAQDCSHADEPPNYTPSYPQPENASHTRDTVAPALSQPTPSIQLVQPTANEDIMHPEAMGPSARSPPIDIPDNEDSSPLSLVMINPSTGAFPLHSLGSPASLITSPSSLHSDLVATISVSDDDDEHGLRLEELSVDDYNLSFDEIEEILSERGRAYSPTCLPDGHADEIESISSESTLSQGSTIANHPTYDTNNNESIHTIVTLTGDASDSAEQHSAPSSQQANPASPDEHNVEPFRRVQWGSEYIYEFDCLQPMQLHEERLGMQHKEHMLPIREHGCRETQPNLKNGTLTTYDNTLTTKRCISGFHWHCDKPSQSCTWFPVTRGKRVGVFDNSSVPAISDYLFSLTLFIRSAASVATSGLTGVEFPAVLESRSTAIQVFVLALYRGECRVMKITE